jgi:hypothetical protein
MMRTFKSGLTIGLMVAAMALSAGCGDNDNGHGDNGNDNNDNGGGFRTSTPSRTSTPGGATSTPGASATPAPTATGGGNTANVSFNVASSAGVQGFDVRVAYPTAKGSFTGTGEDVACSTSAGGSFIKNDNDTGSLTLIVGNASNLTFPITITCTFDATGTLAASDLTVTVREVTQNGAPGDATVLTVTPSVS